MNLTQKQKLFLHNVLFHYNSNQEIDSSVRLNVEKIMGILSDELTNSHANSSEKETFDDDDDLNYDMDRNQIISVLTSLSDLRVKDPETENLYTLQFVRTNKNLLSYDLYDNDDLADTVHDVIGVTRNGSSLVLHKHDPAETYVYTVTKFPKDWTNELPPGKKITI